MRRASILAAAIALWPTTAQADACVWGFPVGDVAGSPAPLANNHPVGGMNLPSYGSHLGADYWSGGGCTDFGQPVYAAADGTIVEIVDALGSYLDVVVIEHDDPTAGLVYSMYGHIARDAALVEGQEVALRQQIGTIDDVLAYFSPCHLHFELLTEVAFQEGPFCNGCEAAGYHVSPGYDRQVGVVEGNGPGGDAYLEVVDAIDGNAWYRTDEFITPRLDATCSSCGDTICDPSEDCPEDCAPPDSSTSSTSTSTPTPDDSAPPLDESSGDASTSTTSDAVDPDTGSGESTLPPSLPGGMRGADPSGCACTTERAYTPALWLLLVALRRRRRRP